MIVLSGNKEIAEIYFVVDVSIELVTVSITRIADARAGSPTIISVPLANPNSSKTKETFPIETFAINTIVVRTLQCHPKVDFGGFSHLFGTGHVKRFRRSIDFRIDQRRR